MLLEGEGVRSMLPVRWNFMVRLSVRLPHVIHSFLNALTLRLAEPTKDEPFRVSECEA